MKGNRELGQFGEDAVGQYLVENGHTVIERNWRSGHLEVDIISLARDGIHFVEVKSRTVPVQGSPQDAITSLKMKNIATAAGRYMTKGAKSLDTDVEVHFDVAAVTCDGGNTEIQYFPDAYIPLFI